MTIQIRLLSSVMLGMLFVNGVALADTKLCTKSFKVLVRDSKEGYKMESKDLEDLFCSEKFEGAHFKIVNGTSDEAISFKEDNPKLLQKAANVYYHLSVARKYWISTIKSEFVAKLPQTIVRLDITNSFSDVRHYKNVELEKNYNNAWTIPEGKEPEILKNPKSWGKEIWFSPMRQIKTSNLIESEGNNPIHESLLAIKDPIIDFSQNNLIYSGLNYLNYPAINQSYVLDTAITNLGILAILYGSIEITKHMDKMFIDKFYFIETAMVPEIIYHEFAHIAMSDYLKTVHSIPVIEGMADYFAALIAKRDKMYEKMDDFSTNRFKDVKNKSLYSPYLEGAWNATSDFTLSLLWRAKLDFEEANSKRTIKKQPVIADFNQIVYKAHFELDENSDIANGLTKALVNACKDLCSSVRAGVNTLQYSFEKKGLN